MLKFERAIDRFGEKRYKINKTGIMFPPPPIPAPADSKITRKRTIDPKNSPLVSGKTSLCIQSFLLKSHIS